VPELRPFTIPEVELMVATRGLPLDQVPLMAPLLLRITEDPVQSVVVPVIEPALGIVFTLMVKKDVAVPQFGVVTV